MVSNATTLSATRSADDATMLPVWMRRALYATAAMNVVAAIGFLPPAHALRALAGLPEADHALYLTTVSMFVLLFGLAYYSLAVSGRPDRFFLTIAAAGKLSFFALLAVLWIGGTLPFRAVLAGSGDLVFGLLFVAWLYG
jgi:hypothetical protein